MWREEWTTEAGVKHVLERTADGLLLDHMFQDVAPILDLNQQMRDHGGDGYISAEREMKRVASIPTSLLQLWRTVEGWDPLHPGNADRLARKLNDIDFYKLRTAPGRV